MTANRRHTREMLMRRRGRRGFVLVGSYLILSLFFVFSNALTMRTMTQRVAAERHLQQLQALDLAQGAMEQLRVDFNYFLTVPLYQGGGAGVVGGQGLWSPGDAVKTLEWLDALGDTVRNGAAPELPYLIMEDRNGDGQITTADMVNGELDAVPENPRTIAGLPTIPAGTQAAQAPRAWIVGVEIDPNAEAGDPLATRLVSMEAVATVGSATKRIRSVYQVEMGMSDIFRYAYFLNNYGWFDLQGTSYITINGDVRSNGDLTFSGNTGNMRLQGNLFASQNSDLNNPVTGVPSTGYISGDPSQHDAAWYVTSIGHPWTRRPTKQLSLPGQPPKGGTARELPPGYGWDSEYRNSSGNRDQHRYDAQTTHPMPYLGDLTFYKDLAVQRGGTIDYCCDAGGNYITIDAVYHGPDGVDGTADDDQPLQIRGSASKPIYLNGPVVAQGDVLIDGYVSGRGTVYSGRNMHILAGLHYLWNRPEYIPLERDLVTGRVRSAGGGSYYFGTICQNGSYFTEAETTGGLVPNGCVP